MPSPSNVNRSGMLVAKRNPNLSKWNFLFDKGKTEWISFKPQMGFHVYPCYVCRNMFASKTSLLDHVNRRAAVLQYQCPPCQITLTFYNSCALLLHVRDHFQLDEGHIVLSNLEISMLPIGLAGFPSSANIPSVYNAEEEAAPPDTYINSQFYSPSRTDEGKETVSLHPTDIYIYDNPDYSPSGMQLAIQQICTNIPKCQFVSADSLQALKKAYRDKIINEQTNQMEEEVEVKIEPADDIFTIPIISKIESLHQEANNIDNDYAKCPECKEVVKSSMNKHFLGSNLPLDVSLSCSLCRFIAPTECCLKAHARTHVKETPFVCPECGKDFRDADMFQEHLDDVCFHLAKQVRFRCPGRRCGKLFAMVATYSSHFECHLHFFKQCGLCNATFLSDNDALEHEKVHYEPAKSKWIYTCTVCENAKKAAHHETYQEHIEWHTSDRTRCTYVYICRFCKNYFRSTNTYAVHLLKCSKVGLKKSVPRAQKSTLKCKLCGLLLSFTQSEIAKECNNCRTMTYLPSYRNIYKISSTNPKDHTYSVTTDKNNPKLRKVISNHRKSISRDEAEKCILCKHIIQPTERILHLRTCIYSNPVVILDKKMPKPSLNNQRRSSSESEIDSRDGSVNELDTSKSNSSPTKSDDGGRKRRKRSIISNRNKKVNVGVNGADVEDLQAEIPKPFDGTYVCKVCEYSNTDRNAFHKHIVVHRDISTSYQCMECGECFVVKPSLMKHLKHYHNVRDTEKYFDENDCFDKQAVKQLVEMLKTGSQFKGSVEDNQCRVCLRKFPTRTELGRHFRVHGMAFLMSNSK